MSRTELLERLHSAREIICKISTCQGKINKIQSSIDAVEDKFAKNIKKKSGCLLTVLVFAILGSALLGFLGFIFGIICGNVIYHFLNKIVFEKMRTKRAQVHYNLAMPPLIEEIEKLATELQELWDSQECLKMQELIPQDYSTTAALDWIIKSVENQRADTIKEVINLYEDMLHKERVEAMQERQISLAKATLRTQIEQISIAKAQEEYALKTTEYAAKTAKSLKQISKSARYGNVLNTLNTVHHWGKK